MRLGIQQVKPIAEGVADAHPDRMNEDCLYSSPCLVGAILQELDIAVPEQYDGASVRQVPWLKIADTTFTEPAMHYLANLQYLTDRGATWGKAVSA